jgi:SAM-dependent methyltransferase
VQAEITVSDLCPTPLAATRRYAQLVGARVETVAADAVGLAALGPFDAICSHLIYGWIRPDRRPGLVRSWASLLRPGGRVVTNAGVWRGEGPPAPRDRRGQLERFDALVLERARAWKDVLGIAPEVARAMASEFLSGWRGRFARPRPEEVEAVFAGAGFDVTLEVRGRTSLVRPDWNPAPDLDPERPAERGEAWITAVRPDPGAPRAISTSGRATSSPGASAARASRRP